MCLCVCACTYGDQHTMWGSEFSPSTTFSKFGGSDLSSQVWRLAPSPLGHFPCPNIQLLKDMPVVGESTFTHAVDPSCSVGWHQPQVLEGHTMQSPSHHYLLHLELTRFSRDLLPTLWTRGLQSLFCGCWGCELGFSDLYGKRLSN